MWAGSKDKNWKDIKKYIPKDYEYYIEPFVGGGATYFRVLNDDEKKHCKIADINRDLISTYDVMRDNSDYIIKNLPAKKDKDTFKKYMKPDASLSKNEKGMRFLYLNRNRFFGMGGWMVADRYARTTVVDRIKFYAPRMKNTITYDNAFSILIGKNDFVFCDPPYPETNNNACYRIEDDEILKLNIDYLKNVNDSGARFLFITKNIESIRNTANKLKLKVDVKKWTFRKPKKDPVVGEEIWISNLKIEESEFFDL
jgi:DNA adenine methylase